MFQVSWSVLWPPLQFSAFMVTYMLWGDVLTSAA